MGLEMFRYDDKRVLVVGGASGMGLATAHVVADLGAEVLIADVQDPLEAVQGSSFTRIDLRHRVSIDEALSGVGEFDAVMSCAGVADGTPGLPEINFLGQRYLLESLLGAGAIRSGGAIAMIASIGGTGWQNQVGPINELLATTSFEDGSAWFASRPELCNYAFTKQAVIGYCAARGVELIRQGIRINCTAPGAVMTPLMAAHDTWQQFEMGVHAATGIHGATPPQQAYPLAFLGSPAASYVNGTCLYVDAGFIAGAMMGVVDSPLAQALVGESRQGDPA